VLGINEPPSPSSSSSAASSSAPGTRAGFIPSRPSRTPASAWPSWAAARPGLAAAQQLRRAGHSVTVFEKNDRIGGLLRYGIPNFKMEKHLIDRRIEQMRAEGVTFQTNAHVGVNVPVEDCAKSYDAILLAAAPSSRAT
jgi:glutamate synthase (NADPH/NADH) small chain